MSIVDADPTLPLALALALEPPAAALALAWLNVAIYRRRQEQIEVSRSEELSERETEEQRKLTGEWEIAASSPPFRSPAGGGSSPATASGGACAGGTSGRLVGGADVRAAARGGVWGAESARSHEVGYGAQVLRGLGRIPKTGRDVSSRRINLFTIYFFPILHRHVSTPCPRRIRVRDVSDT